MAVARPHRLRRKRPVHRNLCELDCSFHRLFRDSDRQPFSQMLSGQAGQRHGRAGWLGRVGGALYGPLLVIVIAMHVITSWSLIVAWLGTTLGGLFAAKSSSTNGKVEQKSNGGKVPLEILARVAPYVFLVGFLLLIAFGVH